MSEEGIRMLRFMLLVLLAVYCWVILSKPLFPGSRKPEDKNEQEKDE